MATSTTSLSPEYKRRLFGWSVAAALVLSPAYFVAGGWLASSLGLDPTLPARGQNGGTMWLVLGLVLVVSYAALSAAIAALAVALPECVRGRLTLTEALLAAISKYPASWTTE